MSSSLADELPVVTDSGGSVVGDWELESQGAGADLWSVTIPSAQVPVSTWTIPGMATATVTGPGTGGRYRVRVSNVSAEPLLLDHGRVADLAPGEAVTWDAGVGAMGEITHPLMGVTRGDIGV